MTYIIYIGRSLIKLNNNIHSFIRSSDNANNVVASLVTSCHFIIQIKDPKVIGFGLRNPNYIQILQHQFDLKKKIFLECTFCFDNRHVRDKGVYKKSLSSINALQKFCSKAGIKPLKNNITEYLGIIYEEKFTLYNTFKVSGFFEIENLEFFNFSLANGLGSRRSYGFGMILIKEIL